MNTIAPTVGALQSMGINAASFDAAYGQRRVLLSTDMSDLGLSRNECFDVLEMFGLDRGDFTADCDVEDEQWLPVFNPTFNTAVLALCVEEMDGRLFVVSETVERSQPHPVLARFGPQLIPGSPGLSRTLLRPCTRISLV